jgi:hypothetical protein
MLNRSSATDVVDSPPATRPRPRYRMSRLMARRLLAPHKNAQAKSASMAT